jgi:hypothetical protein
VFSAADADQGEPDASDANVAEAGVQALATILEQRHEDLELNRALRQRLRAARAATRGATRAHKATWVRRQRRRVDKVRQDPALLAKRLRRSRPWL